MREVGGRTDTASAQAYDFWCEHKSLPIYKRLPLLSSRQRQVFDLACHGFLYKEVSELLFVSKRTVEIHSALVAIKLSPSSFDPKYSRMRMQQIIGVFYREIIEEKAGADFLGTFHDADLLPPDYDVKKQEQK